MLLHTPISVVIDVGALPAAEVRLALPCVGCVATSNTVAWVSGAAPPGKDADEVEMDTFRVSLVPGIDSVILVLRGLEGYIHDKFVVCCCVG